LLQDLPGVKELLFDTGCRDSDYTSKAAATSTEFQAHTYKFEVQYAPIQDIRLRVSYDKAIRAPSIVELYSPQLVGLIQSGDDPCAPPVSMSAAQCAHLGVSAAQYAASVAGAAVIPACFCLLCNNSPVTPRSSFCPLFERPTSRS
jgi:iron complex outermembrane recepter protein